MTGLLICAAVTAAGGSVFLITAGMAVLDGLDEVGGVIGGFGLVMIAGALWLPYAAGGA